MTFEITYFIRHFSFLRIIKTKKFAVFTVIFISAISAFSALLVSSQIPLSSIF
jgi:hypothetical protein